MLKISKAENPGHEVILQLEGKVIEGWVQEMERVCRLALDETDSVRLDLADVTFADRAGLRALADLKKRGVTLLNCSLFLTEQLKAVGHEC